MKKPQHLFLIVLFSVTSFAFSAPAYASTADVASFIAIYNKILSFLHGGQSSLLGQVASSVKNGMVAHYTFDENTGSTAADSVGSNNLTVHNSTWTTGKTGNALSMNGRTSYAEVDSSPISSFPFTFTVWTKSTGGGVLVSLEDKNTSTSYYTLGLSVDGKANLTSRSDVGSANTTIDSNPLDTSGWHFLTAVFENNTDKKLYVDGVLAGTLSASKALNIVNRLSVGRIGRASSAGYYNGIIDDVRIYNRALSGSEIAYLYNGSSVEIVSSVQPKTLRVKKDGYGDFTTIQECLSVAIGGDTCLVSPGRYVEPSLTFSNSGSSGKVINVVAEYPYSRNSSSNRTIIQGNITMKSFTHIEGFEFDKGRIIIDGNNVDVIGMYAHGDDTLAPYDPIGIKRAKPYYSNINIKNNYLYQVSHGMGIYCGNNCLIENNDIERLFTVAECRPTASKCGADVDYVRIFGNGITFRGNKLHGSILSEIWDGAHVDGIQAFNNGGLGGQGYDTITNIVIENNFISDCHQTLWMSATNAGMLSENITIRNNIFYDSWGTGARAAVSGDNFDKIYVYNNIFNQSVKITAKDKVIIKNNFFYGNFMNTSDDRFLWPQRSYEMSNNIFGITSSWLNRSTQKYYEAVLTGNKFAENSALMFVGPGDFRLQPGSIAIDTGTNLSSTGFNKDYAGVSRPQGSAWDIGAYEYVGGNSGVPAVTFPQPTLTPTPSPTPVPVPTIVSKPLPPVVLGPAAPGVQTNSSDSSVNNAGASNVNNSTNVPNAGGSFSTPSITSANTNPVNPSIVAPVCVQNSFGRTLTLGSSGTDVKALQVFLNTHGFTIATTGAGAPGYETTYFGPATKRALAQFQTSNNINSGTGSFDLNTRFRALMSAASSCSTNAQAATPVINQTPTSVQSDSLNVLPQVSSNPLQAFTRSLTLGSTGADVKALQVFLNTHGFIVATTGAGSFGHETTYFGPATMKAVIRFQEGNAATILSPVHLTRGTGYVGPSTLKALNRFVQ